jgi:sedoheptulokinase
MYLMGLDIGTTSVCGVLIDAHNGEIIKSLMKDNHATLETTNAWEFIQDPDMIFKTIQELIEELSGKDISVRGIGISGQMHGILYVDEFGNHVSPLYTWQDKRGSLPFSESTSYVEHLTMLTSYPVSTGFGMVTHFYNIHQGLVPEKAVTLCTIADYIAMKLCGCKSPVIDPTNAASLGLFHLESVKFDQEALNSAKIVPQLLPDIVPTGTVIGQTDRGISVVCAVGDNQASFLGAVRDIKSSILINIGTGSQISVFSDCLLQVEGLETRPFPGGGYILVGASLSGGKSYALLENFFREVCGIFAGYEESLYEQMNLLAKSNLREETKLKVNTQFFGTRKDPSKQGAIEQISAKNFTPQHLIVGFLEGIIEELLAYYREFPDRIKRELNTVVGSGNGVRKNQALCQMLEKTFDLSIQIPLYPEEASYGAAICAGVGSGLYENFASSPGMPSGKGGLMKRE